MTKPSRAAKLILIAALLLGSVIVFQWMRENPIPTTPVETLHSTLALQTETPLSPSIEPMLST